MLVPLLLIAPSEAASAQQVSVGVVPNVVGMNASPAADTVQAAGFAVDMAPGSVDCGSPYVQFQSPAGGTSAPLGSTVVLYVSQWPAWGDPCP